MNTPNLAHEKYVNLETFKKNGTGVKTPVWFAEENSMLYVYTEADVGKVKRIRNNPRVRIAACNMRGKVHGDWIDATAHMADELETRKGQALLKKKYWPWKSIGDFFSRLRGHRQAIMLIRPASELLHPHLTK
jgi:PPOX class probable F420-dependent enzyme